MKINLNGGVGFDFTAETIREKIDGYSGDVELHINSAGGDVYSGIEIYNELRKYQRDTGSKVTAYFSGFVASAASYLAMAADERIAYDNSVFMLHNAMMGVIGDNRTMQFWADDLRKTDKIIAIAYSKASGKQIEEIHTLMNAGEKNSGTFLYGEEILEAGFATKLENTDEEKDKENHTNASKMLFAKFVKESRPAEYDHERIVAMVKENEKLNAREGDDNLEGVSEVKKDEVLNALSVFKANAEITLPEIAKHLGLDGLLITDEQKSNLSEYAKAKSLCGDKAISEVIAEMVEEKKANAEKVRQAKLDEAFGLSVNPANKVENSSRAYAEVKLNGVELTDEKIAEVKEDKLYKKLAAEFADMDSDWNRVGMVDKKTNDADAEKSGVVVV